MSSETTERPTRSRRIVIAVIAATAVFAGGYFYGGRGAGGHDQHGAAGAEATPSAPDEAKTWTCSMHPQIPQPSPGACPLCGMDLIPLVERSDDLGPRELKLSAAARELAQIEVAPVERRWVSQDVRMVGTVTYDETRLATITAWVGGRLDRLFVDYTGITVRKGDHLVWMYSPEILAAQEELLQARNAAAEMSGTHLKLVRESAEATLAATRDKLRLWGLTPKQIEAVETRGTASDHIQINAPIGGVVIHKNVEEGMYVQTGTPIYRIADLTQVWIQLDAYESDLPWLRYGQEVEFSTESRPGETFIGRIAFINPTLTEKTRTVKVRINVPNGDGKLKPGMFVRATVQSRVAADGNVMDAELTGKWISPMHPEIIKDGPGACDICGMPLVPAEELFVTAPVNAEPPLAIPATAPLITGKRAVVYVQDPERAGVYAGREVVLGSRAGGFYIVVSGLTEGELVVVNGNFKLDSALQIRAQPSMMSAAAAEPEKLTAPDGFLDQLAPLFDAYLQTQKAFAADNLGGAQTAAGLYEAALAKVEMTLVKGDAHMAWMALQKRLSKSAGGIVKRDDIDMARGKFDQLSAAMIELGQQFGTGQSTPVNIVYCPMAFDNEGASWLQRETAIANPYFGTAILNCGEVKATLGSDVRRDVKLPVKSPKHKAEGSHHEGSHH